MRTVIVSNCSIDIRDNLAAHGLAELVDDFVLSFEHGVVKPDRRLFEIALGSADPGTAIMVGDSTADAGATAAGIATILLPPAPDVTAPRGLDLVTRTLGLG